MNTRSIKFAALVAVLGLVIVNNPAAAQPIPQSSVVKNSNVVGVTAHGQYRGIPAMQDNEPDCAVNPLLPLNVVCAWNASGGADDVIGDTWLRMSETVDGINFFNRYVTGSPLDLATSNNQQFAADAVTMCWPGGCGIFMLASTRAATGGGTGGGIYMQRMMDTNVASGPRKRLEAGLVQAYRSTGSHFADKPHGIYMLDEQNPGTVPVTMNLENADGSTESVTRFFPKARILLIFALFNPSKSDIEILSMYSDNYGDSWSNAKQVAVSSGRDQGVSVAAIGRTIFYGFRRFADDGDTSAMMGAVSTNWGQKIGKPFEVVPDLCAYDVPTLPSASSSTAAASRTNDFPVVSENGSNFIMLYSERTLNSDGSCFTAFDEPTDSRIKVVIGSANGKNWGDPVEVAPYAGHGFQFMPAVDCSLGICQGAWWDTRRNSTRTINFLQGQASEFADNALTAFLNYPVFADFNYQETPTGPIMQFRNTADQFTTKIQILDGLTAVATENPPVLASRYRLGLYQGEVVEVEFNPFHVKAYKSSTVPFMGDYGSLTSAKLRLSFDPEQPENPPFWESNSSLDLLNEDKLPLFWLAFVDARNLRGQLYVENIDAAIPYTKTGDGLGGDATEPKTSPLSPEAAEQLTLLAENVEDSNPGAGTCIAVPDPGTGAAFIPLNNRTKDFDIYGAMIRNEVSAFSLNPNMTFGGVQRAFTIFADNATPIARTLRMEIANQPVGFPTVARASWQQLPFDADDTDPTVPPFSTPPDDVLSVDVEPQSSAAAALFVVSQLAVNPVTVNIFDDDTNELINSVTVDGAGEAGLFLNADGTPNNFEVHDPVVLTPDLFNPDQFNPDQYNPDQFNPDLYNPDQFNPDQFNPDQYNPDQYNPDQYNPDQYNPDQYNPDQFNPDQFNPDQFNPDQFNTNLTDAADLDNPEIADPELGSITGLVTKLDLNYAVFNTGNTITPYTADFAIGDTEIRQMLANGEIVTQLIAWQDKHVSDVQFCEPRLITENRVVAVVNNPDLFNLSIPDIANNRFGSITFVVAPFDMMQMTLRIIGPADKVQTVADKLPVLPTDPDIISYVFASQAANTNNIDLGVEESEINDLLPPVFNFFNEDTVTFPATSSSGADIPADLVTAAKGEEVATVTCSPALPTTIDLDIKTGGPTPLSCSATAESNGITATLDMFISVLDTAAPTINSSSVPSDVTVEATSSAGAPVVFSTPTATDASGVDLTVDVTCDANSGDTFPFESPGPTTTTVTCTAEDDSFNTDTASFDITVQDTTAPELVGLPSDITEEAEAPIGADVFYTLPTATDIADTHVVPSCTPEPNTVFAIGTTTVTCTATDDSDNTVTGTFEVLVEDMTPPTFDVVPLPDVTAEAPSSNGATVNYAVPTASDIADANPLVSCAPPSGSLFSIGATTVTCTATDVDGNSATATFQVTVQDTAPPVLVDLPADIIKEAEASFGPGIFGADVFYTLPTATDVADTSVIPSCAPLPNTVFFNGSTTVTCTATDDSNNTVTGTFQVTVVDTTAPVIGALANITAEATSPAGAVVTYSATASDIADVNPSVVCTPASGSVFPITATTVTCTATDADGNSATATFEVTVQDTTPSVLVDLPADIIKEAEANFGPGVFGADVVYTLPTATDVADTSVVPSCAPAPNTVFFNGSTTVTCTATDDSNNSVSGTFQVTVVDTTAPVFDALANIAAEATSPAGAAVTYNATASDIADANPSVICAPASGSVFPITATTVTCTAADVDGNSVTDAFQVTIQDTTVPVIALLGDAPLTVEAGTPYVEQGATVIDIADPAPVLIINSALVNTAAVGSYSVFYDAVDAAGNAAPQVVRTVDVVDTTEPSLDGFDPPEFDQDEPFVLDPDLSTFPLIWTGGVDDTDPDLDVSCDVGNFVSADPPLYTFSYGFFPAGDTVVTCTATDSNDNSDSVSFTVTVLDETAPVIMLLGDPTVTIDTNFGPYVDAGATAFDNADGSIGVDIDSSGVDTTTAGTYTVHFSATDNAGNTSVATRTVTVIFAYAGWTDVDPAKRNLKLGSANPLYWAWLDSNGDPVDSSGDTQLLRVEFCATGEVVFMVAGDPGSSGFRFNTDNFWQFNLQYDGNKGDEVCAVVQSSLTGQEQSSPSITYR